MNKNQFTEIADLACLLRQKVFGHANPSADWYTQAPDRIDAANICNLPDKESADDYKAASLRKQLRDQANQHSDVMHYAQNAYPHIDSDFRNSITERSEITHNLALILAASELETITTNSGDGYPELFRRRIESGHKFTYRFFMKHLSDAAKQLLVASNHSDHWLALIIASRHLTGRWSGFMKGPHHNLPDLDHDIVLRQLHNQMAQIDASVFTSLATATQPQKTDEPMQASAIKKTPIEFSDKKSGEWRTTINTILSTCEIAAPIDALIDAYNSNVSMSDLTQLQAEHAQTVSTLERQLQTAKQATVAPTVAASADGSLPEGKRVFRPASQVFPVLAGVDTEIMTFEWSGKHPDVPGVDSDYVFQREPLLRAIMGLNTGSQLWITGHTGTGKTTLLQQIAAATGWPFARIAMDSSIDRAELTGRAELTADGSGGTSSHWLPGVLERTMPNGYLIALDEFDAARPDAAMVLQPILEGNSLRLLEDGNREVPLSKHSRFIALGNTAGNGDDTNLYPATRTLNAATLDRFTSFVKVDYLPKDQEAALLKSRTGIAQDMAERIADLAYEIRRAFTTNEISISLSPRRTIAMARMAMAYCDAMSIDISQALIMAVQETLINPAPDDHCERIKEIASNTIGYSASAQPAI